MRAGTLRLLGRVEQRELPARLVERGEDAREAKIDGRPARIIIE